MDSTLGIEFAVIIIPKLPVFPTIKLFTSYLFYIYTVFRKELLFIAVTQGPKCTFFHNQNTKKTT
jgi:hypothetical protein